MQVVGRFLIKESFTITRVGFTILGELVDGKVNRGNQLTFDTGSEKITATINAIDFADNISTGIAYIGLRFPDEKDGQKATLTGVKITEQLVNILTT